MAAAVVGGARGNQKLVCDGKFYVGCTVFRVQGRKAAATVVTKNSARLRGLGH